MMVSAILVHAVLLLAFGIGIWRFADRKNLRRQSASRHVPESINAYGRSAVQDCVETVEVDPETGDKYRRLRVHIEKHSVAGSR
jgi:hypothetical protein